MSAIEFQLDFLSGQKSVCLVFIKLMAHVNSGQFVVIDKRDMIIAIWEKLFRVAKGNYMSKFMNFDFPNIMFNIV